MIYRLLLKLNTEELGKGKIKQIRFSNYSEMRFCYRAFKELKSPSLSIILNGKILCVGELYANYQYSGRLKHSNQNIHDGVGEKWTKS